MCFYAIKSPFAYDMGDHDHVKPMLCLMTKHLWLPNFTTTQTTLNEFLANQPSVSTGYSCIN